MYNFTMAVVITKQKLEGIAKISILVVVALFFAVSRLIKQDSEFNIAPRELDIAAENCIPAFRDGGGPYYLPNSPFRSNLVPLETDGDKLIVEGLLVNSTCTSIVPNAVIDIWQADETGEYRDETHRGQITTDKDGKYYFKTVIPKGYGEGTAYRPPHIHFKVFVDAKEIVTSQMFFEDVRGRQGFTDEYIIELEEKDSAFYGNYNIILPDFN